MSKFPRILLWPFSVLFGAFGGLLSWLIIRPFSSDAKMRDNARNWLEVADKVWHFRRDQLTQKESAELLRQSGEVRQHLKAKADAGRLKLSIESLEAVLRRTGGAIYPKSSLVENVEFFLVAAIVILGVRTYFVQPFKIPTNSMWPTYNGMTPEVFTKPADEPSAITESARAVLFGAWPHRLDAPADGEVMIPVGGESRGLVHCHTVAGHKWIVIPADLREYSIIVGDEIVKTRVPVDFDFDWTVYNAFFAGSGESYTPQRLAMHLERAIRNNEFEVRVVDGERLRCVRVGQQKRRGERVLSFDELTGDQLFVDRISYNFVRPSVGSGFVFRTENIHSPYMSERGTGAQIQSYYIKRLVGTPGDTVEIKGSTIYRNGAPIAGAAAFEANARRQGNYGGYVPIGLLEPGNTLRVEDGKYFALGDNSGNSQDGRYWGFVPAKDVTGRPLFIYFPFTKHWGPAH